MPFSMINVVINKIGYIRKSFLSMWFQYSSISLIYWLETSFKIAIGFKFINKLSLYTKK